MPASTPEAAAQYREFSDWYGRFNTMSNPGSTPPFARDGRQRGAGQAGPGADRGPPDDPGPVGVRRPLRCAASITSRGDCCRATSRKSKRRPINWPPSRRSTSTSSSATSADASGKDRSATAQCSRRPRGGEAASAAVTMVAFSLTGRPPPCFAHCSRACSLVCSASVRPLSAAARRDRRKKRPQGVTVKVDGQPFTEYLIKSGSKPILWPIIGPTGKRVTRNWPMENGVAGETDRDHPHQRSLWFTHGDVNGIDFWSEGKGRIEHREFVKVEGGPAGRDRHAQRLAQPRRQQAASARRADAAPSAPTPTRRWIDFDIAAQGHARPGRVRRHEGRLIRRAHGFEHARRLEARAARSSTATARRTPPRGANRPPGSTTTGPSTARRWASPSSTIPSSFRFPTHWHVRTYGLFAANPFGLNDFTAGASKGEYTLPAGETHAAALSRAAAQGRREGRPRGGSVRGIREVGAVGLRLAAFARTCSSRLRNRQSRQTPTRNL